MVNTPTMPAPMSDAQKAEAQMKWRKLHSDKQGMEKAGADPLPGPLADAFGIFEKIIVGPVEVRAVVPSDFQIFKALKNHYFRIASGDEASEIGPDEIAELCFQFTNPVRKVRQMIAVSREAFRESAIEHVTDSWSEDFIAKVMEAIGEQMRRRMATHVQFGADEGESEGKSTVFSKPTPAAETASVGSSTT